MTDEFEVVKKQDIGDVSEEDARMSDAIMNVLIPVVPYTLRDLQKVDPTITGAILICWRPGEDGVIVTGNSPPSANVPRLQKVLADMTGTEKDFIEDAFAEGKAKRN